MKKDKQDWKEKFDKELFMGYKVASGIKAFDWIDEKIIQPLQSQNEALQKENADLKEKITKLEKTMAEIIFPDTPIGELQKENERLELDYEKAVNEIGRLQKQLETDENWRE